jgi:HAD superfamily hydrolase (TIGR01509 family)
MFSRFRVTLDFMGPALKSRSPAVIVDLDGTLVDTEPAAHRAIETWARTRGLNLHSDDPAAITGVQWITAAARLAQRHALTDSIALIESELLQEYRKRLKDAIQEVPGAVNALKQIKNAGIPLGLVSGSHRQDVLLCLESLGVQSLISPILGAEDYERGKPDPSGYLKAAQMMGCPPSSIWVFEDSAAGIASARAAGMRVIAITCTNHDQQDQSLADRRVRDWKDFSLDWIA